MHIILADGTQLNHIGATGTTKYIQGANRDTITFEFDATHSVDELRNVFTEANCEVINIVTDEVVENIVEKTIEKEDGTTETIEEIVSGTVYTNNYHEGYVIRAEVAEKIKEIIPATGTTPPITETRIFVTMAQRVYEETQYLELKAQNEMLSECILEMSTVVYAE